MDLREPNSSQTARRSAGPYRWLPTCAAFLVALALALLGPDGFAQVPAPSEPIYWKQNLFLIPYQWTSGADPATAQTVWLLVSRDGGVSWQKISEAKPQVKAFNYHAEADGRYAFAIRTLDVQGRVWPDGPYQPELTVIVDTTMPRIDELSAEAQPDQSIWIRWRASDLNLDPTTWRIETQVSPTAPWQTVPLQDPAAGQVSWRSPDGSIPSAVRCFVMDRAGNSAMSQTHVAPARTDQIASQSWQATGTYPSFSPAPESSAEPTSRSAAQMWPASTTSPTPFRLAETTVDSSGGATQYGNPTVIAGGNESPALGWNSAATAQTPISPTDTAAPTAERFAMVSTGANSAVRPLEPFRETVDPGHSPFSAIGADGPQTATAGTDTNAVGSSSAAGSANSITPGTATTVSLLPNEPATLPPGVEGKQVGSRTFAVEYQLTDIGHWGISRVELWGTADGGKSWQRFAEDDDHRSPVHVTVDGAGLYGFRILVEAAGGPPAEHPHGGDVPELWVAVDLDRPRVELSSIQPGIGPNAEQLILRWRAEDANLEARPIGLYYSSRPGGPWSPIATALANTGEYVWHVERHVPPRIYLRVEARDMAGNLAAFQTAESVALPTPRPAGELRSVSPVGPTATGSDASYR